MLPTRTQIVLIFSLLLALPAWSQTGDGAAPSVNGPVGSHMLLPPPISGQAYPAKVGSEEQSNYLGMGAKFSGGYIRNLYPGTGSVPVNDATYLIQPNISLDHGGMRSHELLTYSAAFTYYRPNSTLNTTDQNATAELQQQLSPHISFEATDVFQKTSDAFAQSAFSPEGTVSGSASPMTPGIVVPFAPQWSNNANAGLSWQFGPSSMIGGRGTLTELNFTNSSDAQGFYNSNSRGGSGFYSLRMADEQYLGAIYQYSWIQATPLTASDASAESVVQTHNVMGFYTHYLSAQLSLSVAGGAEHYEIMQSSLPELQSWAPVGTASLGWQGLHTSFAAGYTRSVASGEGVIGAFTSNSEDASARWRVSRLWTIGMSGQYSEIKNVAPDPSLNSIPGGHTLMGNASLQYKIGNNLNLSFQYMRLHQTYGELPAIARDPNSDQILVSLSYRLSRPLGR